jgi:hypothetical protein
MTWERLECATIGADLFEGQEARIADGIWAIGRQWQVGELTGDDASSPLLVQAEVESTPVSRFQPGPVAAKRPIVDIEALSKPLETAVEQEDPWATSAGARLAAEAGLQLLRALADNDVPRAARDALRRAFPLTLPDDDALDPVGRAELALLARRSFDARALRAAAALPASITGAAATRAFDAWTVWYDALYPTPAVNTTSWAPSRMEYSFRLGAHPDGDDEVVLDAPEYVGGRLDWYSFDLRTDLAALQAAPAKSDRRVNVIPTTATFAGQAASRWWEVEDSAVWFGDLHAAPEDLARVAVAAFEMSFGDDWFRIPTRVPAGHIARVRQLRLYDSFGREHRIRSCAELDGPDRTWRFFELSGDPSADAAGLADRTCPWLFVAPALAGVTEGAPLEEVLLLRDEIANNGWAAELRVEANSGRVVDRAARARAAMPPPPPAPTGDAWQYRLAQPVQEHLVPLLPVELEDVSGLYLQRGRLATTSTDGELTTRGAVGDILQPDRRLLIEDAEVPSSGVKVTRRWQMARTRNGRYVLWMGRRKGVPGPRKVPGTVFDEVDRRVDQP